MINLKSILLLSFTSLFLSQYSAKAQNLITTIAGGGIAGTDNGVPATDATLDNPFSIATDNAGNVIIADRNNSLIRKVGTNGIITTIAGTGDAGYSGDNGAATLAQLNYPVGVAIDDNGNIYFSDLGNNCIRKINTTGTISTIAGTGIPGYSGDEGLATAAMLSHPMGITLDKAGNIYICDAYNNRIRKIRVSGTITTIAGNGAMGYSGDNNSANLATLSGPYGVTVDKTNNVFFTDYGNHAIRKISNTGIISTVAGTGVGGFGGDNGSAIFAKFYYPCGICTDQNDVLYIADASNSRIRKIDNAGFITTYCGTGVAGFNGDNLPPQSAQIASATGVCVDKSGGIYIADFGNSRIRYVKNTVDVPNTEHIRSTLSVYPNPNMGNFTVITTSSNNQATHILITDVTGRVVNETDTYTNTSVPITLDAPAGMYLITAETNGKRISEKMTISR